MPSCRVRVRMGICSSSATSAARFESSASSGPMIAMAPSSKTSSSTALPASHHVALRVLHHELDVAALERELDASQHGVPQRLVAAGHRQDDAHGVRARLAPPLRARSTSRGPPTA